MLPMAELVSGRAGFRSFLGPSHLTASPTPPPRQPLGLAELNPPPPLKQEEGWGSAHTSARKIPLAPRRKAAGRYSPSPQGYRAHSPRQAAHTPHRPVLASVAVKGQLELGGPRARPRRQKALGHSPKTPSFPRVACHWLAESRFRGASSSQRRIHWLRWAPRGPLQGVGKVSGQPCPRGAGHAQAGRPSASALPVLSCFQCVYAPQTQSSKDTG